MSVENLVGLQAPEKAIQDELVLEIQSHFESYKSKCYFIKLDRINAGVSAVAWVKEFDSAEALDEFYDDSVYYRACVMFKFYKAHCKVLWKGFHRSKSFQVHIDHIDKERPQSIGYNIEAYRMLPKDILQAGIEEMKEMLSASSGSSESK